MQVWLVHVPEAGRPVQAVELHLVEDNEVVKTDSRQKEGRCHTKGNDHVAWMFLQLMITHNCSHVYERS